MFKSAPASLEEKKAQGNNGHGINVDEMSKSVRSFDSDSDSDNSSGPKLFAPINGN